MLTACRPAIPAAHPPDQTAELEAAHPLAPLTEAETGAVFRLLEAHFDADPALPKEGLRFPFLALAEPPKAEVLAWVPGKPIARKAEVHVLHYPGNRAWVAEVDLTVQQVTRLEALERGVQLAVGGEEFEAAAKLVRAYAPWQAAMRARGVAPEHAYVEVWAAGAPPLPDDVARSLPDGQATRLLRCLSFQRGPRAPGAAQPANPYVRPIEGVVVTVDMNARRVVHMSDGIKRPVSTDSGNAETREPVRPLRVTQPEGSDIVRQGRLVRWHGFQFYAVLQPRDGLVLYDVRYDDGGTLRPIAYRLALSEIYVPYGFADPDWLFRAAFDVGEYNAGLYAQTLEVDRDVPSNATFLDALFFADVGPTPENPSGTRLVPRSVALYERDAGILWTRTDPTTGYGRDTRLARELVVTWNTCIGNYIYGFDWIFKLDGSIEVKVALTGTTLNRGTDVAPEASAPKVGKDARGTLVAAPNHQHFFSFRLDLDVDGPENHVMEMEAAHLPDTGFPSAFDAVTQHIAREGHRDASPFTARHWHVESATRTNAFGKPTGYALDPHGLAVPYSAKNFAPLARARFAEHALWLTRQRDGELHAAGKFPNRSIAPDGLPVYTRDAESLTGADVVLWYTTGLTHLARPEDYPVMPTEWLSFTLAPRGFFAQNPALDVAERGR